MFRGPEAVFGTDAVGPKIPVAWPFGLQAVFGTDAVVPNLPLQNATGAFRVGMPNF